MVAPRPQPRTYEDAVLQLAEWHAHELNGGVMIFSFPDPSGEQVRLVEVTDQTAPSGTVIPIGFGRAAGFPFRSVVAQVTPQEWARIEAGQINLPEGWELTRRTRVWPR